MTHSLSLIGPGGNAMRVYAAGSGPALMLLHGFPLDHRMWRAQIDELSSSYHVIVPEFRGFGQTALLDEHYALSDLADDVEFVRISLARKQQIHLCGLSMGGYVAFAYWQKYAANLASLILANTIPEADDEAKRALRLAAAEKVMQHGTWATVQGMMSKSICGQPACGADAAVRQTETLLRSPSPPAVAAAQKAMASRQDFSKLLHKIEVPTQVITGRDDVLCPPEHTAAWADTIPGARYNVIESAGHLSPIENPKAFNQVIRDFVG